MLQRMWGVFWALVSTLVLLALYIGVTIGVMWLIINLEYLWDNLAIN